MGIKTRVRNNKKKVLRFWESSSRKKLRTLGAMLKAELKEKLTGDRSGYTYWIAELSKFYVASAPGEYPAERLGDLRSGIEYVVGMGELGPFLKIGSDMSYATSLEERDRPFISRIMIENLDNIKDAICSRQT